MKKLSSLALCVSMAFTISACGNDTTQATPKIKAQVAVDKNALVSGVELANMQTEIRPQDDFYRYVNGKWLESTPIPADKSNYGSFTALYDNSQKALKQVVEAAAKNSAAVAGSDEKKLGDFYTSYMDVEKVESLGLSPLQPYLAKIEQVKDHQALVGLMAELRIAGSTTPFAWYINNDAKNSSQYAAYFFQSGIGLPDRDYYLDESEKFVAIRADYHTYIAKLFTQAGFDNADARAAKVVSLETELAKVQWSRVENRYATKRYNKMDLAQVNELTSDFDFVAFLRASNLATNSVIISQPSYFEKFGELYGKTELSIWQDYLSYHFINTYAGLLNKAMVDHKFAFFSARLKGVEQQQPRWKKAVDSANSVLGEMLGKIYVKEYFPVEAKKRMSEMVANLIKAYELAINDLEWMSDATKVAAKEKLSKFTPKIGYPDKWKDYSALEIKADDLVGNFIRHSQWVYQDMSSKMGQPVDRNEWFMTPQTVNAYYNPVNNEIVFPAAILQPPFFNLAADDAINYGAIGAVIGHELGHGFDDQGAKYDGDGNLRNWWSESDLAQFKARGDKLVAQYDQFKPFPDANVNGRFTLGENIGDLGGLTVAYKAYQLSLNGKPSKQLDGYTGEQRFFIGWSQVWRRNYREEALRNRLLTDTHSPSEYRVIGVLSNMPEFYEAFNVKEGDKMYLQPEQRVKIW